MRELPREYYMNRLLLPLLMLSALPACRSDVKLVVIDEPLSLEVTSPAYGSFHGDGPVLVEGRVEPGSAEVLLEGAAVAVEGGSFSAWVDLDGPWEVVEVEASHGDETERIRVPVFAGAPPAETWPGASALRLLPPGLSALGGSLGGLVDQTGWASSLAVALPDVSTDWFSLVPLGVTHEPSEVVLEPAEDGVTVGISLHEVTLHYEADLAGYVAIPLSVGFGVIRITALALPEVDGDGRVWLELTDASLDLGEPEIQVGSVEAWIAEWLVDLAADYLVEPLADLLVDLLLDQLGTLDLGGPYELRQDLAGLSLDLALEALAGDLDGLWGGVAVGLDEPRSPGASEVLPRPSVAHAPDAQAALALHEHVLDLAFGDTLLGFLDLEFTLAGMMGEVVGSVVRNLPGGGEAPDADGWCVSVDPGTATVVRLQKGLEPLAILHAPDLRFRIRVLDGGACWDWLETSLATDLALEVSHGTVVGMDLSVHEGAVISYEATGAWDEEAVVDGVAGLLRTVGTLLGGMVEMDLAELLGGGAGLDLPMELEPALRGSVPLVDEDGGWVEGLFVLSLDIWPDGSATDSATADEG